MNKLLIILMIAAITLASVRLVNADHSGASPAVSVYEYITVTNNHYDIHYDGNTCFQWLADWHPVVVLHPIVIYNTPIDDFDLIQIIACVEKR